MGTGNPDKQVAQATLEAAMELDVAAGPGASVGAEAAEVEEQVGSRRGSSGLPVPRPLSMALPSRIKPRV